MDEAPSLDPLSKKSPADHIFAEQVDLLYSGTLLGSVVHLITPAVLYMVHHVSAPKLAAFLLLTYFLALVAVRMLLNMNIPKGPRTAEADRRWARYYLACLTLTGAGWGAAAFIFIPSAMPEQQVFTGLVVAGMASGALVSMSAIYRAYLLFVIPATVPSIGVYLSLATPIGLSTGALAALLVVFLILTARRINSTLTTATELRFQTQALFDDLARRNAETDRLNSDLTREIGERLEVENRLKKALEAEESANRAKTEFLASVSHELRTPLNAVLGYAQLMTGLSDRSALERRQKYANEIIRSGNHLLGLIDQILELSKIEAGELSIALGRVEIRELVESCINMMNGKARERNVRLQWAGGVAELPAIRSDGGRLRQVLINLLDNAIKYNRSGGTVTVTAAHRDDGHIRISVSDTGPGIAEKHRVDLFEPFNRLGREAGGIEGTGIGLTICAKIMASLGGRIDFTSEIGSGSTFWIDLPMPPSDRPDGGSEPPKARDEAAPA